MTSPDPTAVAEVRAWLKDAAHTRGVEWIRNYVGKQWDKLIPTVSDADAQALTVAPEPGEWSAIEAYHHLVQWQWQVGEDILHACLMGERPGNPFPDFPFERDELSRRARESVESVWAHVSAADPEAFLDLTWEHPFFGALDWREWYLFLAVHAIDHTGQIRAALGLDDA